MKILTFFYDITYVVLLSVFDPDRNLLALHTSGTYLSLPYVKTKNDFMVTLMEFKIITVV